MTTHDVLAHINLDMAGVLRISTYLLALYIVYCIGVAFYVAFLGPLRKFPGPIWRKLSYFPDSLAIAQGNEPTRHAALHARYGPIVRITPNKLSFMEGSQAYKDIYGFKRHGQGSTAKDPAFYSKPFNNVDSLVTADNVNHRRQRRVLSHAFSDKTLRQFQPMLKFWVEKMKKKLEEHAVKGEKVDLVKFYSCATFDIMGDLSFSEDLGTLETGKHSEWMDAVFDGIKFRAKLRAFTMISSVTRWIVHQLIKRNAKIQSKLALHWSFTKDLVDRRLEKTPERPDLWTKIIEKGPDGLSIEEQYSHAALFMVAGTEATASAVSGMTYLLLRHPKSLQRLTTEIREACSSFADVSLESLQKLRYLEAVIQEGLRCYPPAPIILARVVSSREGLVVCGEWVPKGTQLGVHPLSANQWAANFTDPLEFRPERWLGDPKYQHDRREALQPFSIGPRNCLGKNLAWHEMRLMLATVLLHFDLELCDESTAWADQKVYVLCEKGPLMCRLKLAGRAK